MVTDLGSVFVPTVVECRSTFHPERYFSPDTLDFPDQPWQVCLFSLSILVSSLGNQQIRDDSNTIITQEFGNKNIRIRSISLFRLEIPSRGDGEVTTLVGI
jgi:hypothetical protein